MLAGAANGPARCSARELESHFLHQAGYSVAFEQDGNGALAQARKIVPDIIITEILVPLLDGLVPRVWCEDSLTKSAAPTMRPWRPTLAAWRP